jgi:uncharacterized protein
MRIPLALPALLALIPFQLHAASFDCAQASTAVERTICAHPRLSRLDEELATAFTAMLGNVANPAALRERQREWLKERDACRDDACLERLYTRRVAGLRSGTQSIEATRAAALGVYDRRVDGKPDLHAATLTIAAGSGDRIHVSGESTWVGSAETGHVNVGTVDGMAALEGNHARYDADGCSFAVEFLPDALIVSGDNGACGGMNVTFEGDYARVRP